MVEDFTSLVQQRVGFAPVDPAPVDAVPTDLAQEGPEPNADTGEGPEPNADINRPPFAKAPWEYPFNEFKLDGGGKPWKLFPGDAPGEPTNKSDRRHESFVPPTMLDPIGYLCSPNEDKGRWFYDVSEPALVPFLVKVRILPPFRKTAAIIIAPGGGFSYLDWFKEGTRIAKWLNGMGINAFVLKYRVPDLTVTKPLIDAQRAVSLVRSRALFMGIDNDKIGFMGFSGGATIAAEVSYQQERFYTDTELDRWSFKPNFILMVYGIANPMMAEYSVPTFMAIATDDQCASPLGVEGYHMSLKEAGVHSEMHMYYEGAHGFGDCTLYVDGDAYRDGCGWTANAEEWLYSEVLNSHPPLIWQYTGLRRM